MKKAWLAGMSALALAGAVGIGIYTNTSEASDHDDGETDIKARALNLTDHFTFKSPANPDELSIIMYFNPRSLPGKQYFLSTKARYEMHISKAAARVGAPTLKDDFVFRFEAAAPVGDVQQVTMTMLKDGATVGTVMGMTTGFAASKANTITTNTGSVGGSEVKYFIGQRADSFHFDVNRYFQVRNFLANRFFGGAGGLGSATAGLGPNCKGDAFLANILTPGSDAIDGDGINLFNPPSCAPDFTKNLNVTAIVLNVPIAMLGGGTIFDTWSTISVKN